MNEVIKIQKIIMSYFSIGTSGLKMDPYLISIQ